MQEKMKCLAVDIGGTSAKYGIVDEEGTITCKGHFPTGKNMTKEEFLQEMKNVCLLAKKEGALAAGISCLGFINSQEGKIVSGADNLPFLTGMSKNQMLQGIFEGSCSWIGNDCDCAALGEMWLGSAAGCQNFFCMTLGTGIGGSLVLNGRLVQGAHWRAGEIGYFRYRKPDDYLEKHYSTIEVLKEAQRQLGVQSETEGLDGQTFVRMVKEKNEICLSLFEEWMGALAEVLADVILLLDVEKIIIGGGISKEKNLLIPALEAKIKEHLPEQIRDEVKVEAAMLSNDAALLGAAAQFMKRQ